MSMREPRGGSLLAARLAKAYPSLSAYSAASLAEELCRIERAQRRHAERCCSGEDGGYVRKKDFARHDVFDGKAPRGTTEWRKDPNGRWMVEHDPDAEARAEKLVAVRLVRWCIRVCEYSGVPPEQVESCADRIAEGIDVRYDPRGPVLLLKLPGEGEAVAV